MLAGCAQQDSATPPPTEHKTTVFRFTSAPSVCPEPESPKAALKRMTKSRDDWKRYAESIEKLLPADSNHGTHP
jgi:hypothetical protein